MEKTTLVQFFKEMMAMDIFVDPLLVNHYARSLGKDLDTLLRNITETFYQRYVHVDHLAQTLEDIPYSTHLMKLCLKDSIQSTANVISYGTMGSLELSQETVREGASAIAQFITRYGLERLYVLYFTLAGHDLMQPLYFHKDVSEAEFRQGLLHHPYSSEVLDIYLLIGLARASFRIKSTAKSRVLQLTRLGSARYKAIHEVLNESGYIAKRVSLSYVYQFDVVEDWDAMCGVVWPNGTELRNGFVKWIGIQPGQHVLEAGCGTGALTFDSGLYKTVGESGLLTAIDVSSGMLEQAKRKWAEIGKPKSVLLQQASVEHLPFRDGVFDVSVASALLHFVDAKKALSELQRVVVPGGTVAIFQGLEFDLLKPFFRDWFEPIFNLAKRRNAEKPHSYLPTHESVVTWFEDTGFVDIEYAPAYGLWLFDDAGIVVQHLFRGVSFFQTELMELPWDDRRSLIAELIARGKDIVQHYPYADRLVQIPGIMIKGRRPMV